MLRFQTLRMRRRCKGQLPEAFRQQTVCRLDPGIVRDGWGSGVPALRTVSRRGCIACGTAIPPINGPCAESGEETRNHDGGDKHPSDTSGKQPFMSRRVFFLKEARGALF
jgi:hypothetical protein